jgi:hypothetical protein
MQTSQMRLAGIHTFHIFSPVTRQDELRIAELEKWAHESPLKMRSYIENCLDLVVKKITRKNLTTTGGREWLCQILCNTSSREKNYVTHFAIGDDTTPAAEGDTTLGNEVFRKAVSSRAEDGATANISTFIAANEANFEWEEWSHFIDGTDVAGSGVMFSHHIDSTVNKSSPTTITVDSIYSLSDA